jgi:predicted thioesterase
MKSTLVPGLKSSRGFVIDKGRTIDFLGEELRVYATPELVRDIEWTCRDFLLEHADEGEDSVGVSVNINHTGATPLGMTVTVEATVAKVEGRQILFDIVVRDDTEEVCAGRHGRFMIAVEKLRERLGAKVAQVKGT